MLRPPLLVDLPWPAEGTTPPADPDLAGENPKEFGITLTPGRVVRNPRAARNRSASVAWPDSCCENAGVTLSHSAAAGHTAALVQVRAYIGGA
ncbi:hypothetical protein [Streptomyces olivaceoviridis]|uniref:hypothetical protein n=1 Tax=Streptomyces olivaceoviridis TaxID=1921 RepID=UPI003686DBA8